MRSQLHSGVIEKKQQEEGAAARSINVFILSTAFIFAVAIGLL